MFDNALRIEGGPDWHHFHVYTDSEFVAILLVVALLLAILLASAICYYVTRSIMLLIVGRLARQERHKWLRAAERHKVFHRLAPLVPAAIVYAAGPLLSGITFPLIAALGHPLSVLAACYMVYTVLRAALAFLDSVSERYSHFPSASERPIKSFLQIATIVLYVIALIAVISVLLRAFARLLPHGPQRDDGAAHHHLPRFAARLRGEHPARRLRHAAGGRLDRGARLRRRRHGDRHRAEHDQGAELRQFDRHAAELRLADERREELAWHDGVGRQARQAFDSFRRRHGPLSRRGAARPAAQRYRPAARGIRARRRTRRTNLGLYRLYLTAHFRDHPAIRRDMPVVIRQVQSSQPVVALEIFLYVDETSWEPYENLQSDMLDHAYGLVPLFGLRCWQQQCSSSRQP